MPSDDPPTQKQRQRVAALRDIEITAERRDLKCGDCGARLRLKLGRYGRFYGCTKYKKTGCQGSLSAHDDGSPKGHPGDKVTRIGRKEVVEILEAVNAAVIADLNKGPRPDEVPYMLDADWASMRSLSREILDLIEKKPPLQIGDLTKEECWKVTEFLQKNGFSRAGPPTRWDRLLDLETL